MMIQEPTENEGTAGSNVTSGDLTKPENKRVFYVFAGVLCLLILVLVFFN